MSLQYQELTAKARYIHEGIDTDFLDEIFRLFQNGHLETGMDMLGSHLHFLYVTTSASEWQKIVNDILLTHPVHDFIMKDPLTFRSFTRPRGYPGDPKLLDMIYFPRRTNLSETTEIGKQLYKYTVNTSVCRTLRRRLRYIANYIDEYESSHPNATVLSVASGHCREAEYSVALKSGKLGRFVALDHDPRALQKMKNEYADLTLVPHELNVKELIKGTHDLGQFDLIYSAGLYDYLSTRFAQKLTQSLYNMLAPGGRLLLINIASDYDEIGYMESYMNWAMIGRDKLDALDLASMVEANEKAKIEIRDIDLINSHYQVLELEKT